MLRTIIIDDEENIRLLLRNIIAERCPDVEIVAEAGSVADSLHVIRHFSPDLVLLDIRLTDGTGFGLLEKFEAINFRIIFVTAYEEYALKALKLSAVDYILKPIVTDELVAAVEKAKKIIGAGEEQQLKVLIDNTKNQTLQEKKIVLKTADKFHFVVIKDIIRCEADSSYTWFYMVDGTKILISRTMKEFEDVLSGCGFFRPFKTFLINLNHIKAYEKHDGGFIVMTDDSRIPIADRKKEEFFKLIGGL
jgi:two-component system, LytTR family, response regulator